MARRHGVLVELDAILDTRIVCVGQVDVEAALKLVGMREYYQRQIDDFTLVGVSREAFLAVYRQRDVEILKRARMTGLILLLGQVVKELEVQQGTTPHIEEVFIELNIHPYTLSTEEQEELALALSHYVGKFASIRVVDIPLTALTPQHCRSNYTAMFLYNFHDWVKQHSEALIARGIPQISVFAPALYHERVPVADEIKVEGLPAYSPFMLTELALSEAMQLHMQPADVFSLIRE